MLISLPSRLTQHNGDLQRVNNTQTAITEKRTVGAGTGTGADKVGLTQLQKPRMASKLARQMAYKKRLEEEYREFQERCKVRQL